MRRRRFSRREEDLVDQMIQNICREISLPDAYDDEARSIGWCAFLSVYHRNPSCFLWSGAAGWTQVYREIRQELSAFQTQTSAQYHTPSLDRPVGPENDTPRIQLLQCPHGDFGPYICLKDYLRHLPERERWLARTLNKRIQSERDRSPFPLRPEGTDADAPMPSGKHAAVSGDLIVWLSDHDSASQDLWKATAWFIRKRQPASFRLQAAF